MGKKTANSVFKSIGLDGTPQQVLKDMADMLVRLATFVKNHGVWGRSLMTGLMLHLTLWKARRRNCKWISPTSVLRKITERIHFWTHEGEELIRSSQQIYQSKSYLWRWSWTEYWAALKHHSQQAEVGWWFFPSFWHLWRHMRNTSLTIPFLSYVLYKKNTDILKWVLRRVTRVTGRIMASSTWRREIYREVWLLIFTS